MDMITFVLVETRSRYRLENDLVEKAVRRPCRNSGERGSGLTLDDGSGDGEKWMNSRKHKKVLLIGIGNWSRE